MVLSGAILVFWDIQCNTEVIEHSGHQASYQIIYKHYAALIYTQNDDMLQ